MEEQNGVIVMVGVSRGGEWSNLSQEPETASLTAII